MLKQKPRRVQLDIKDAVPRKLIDLIDARVKAGFGSSREQLLEQILQDGATAFAKKYLDETKQRTR